MERIELQLSNLRESQIRQGAMIGVLTQEMARVCLALEALQSTVAASPLLKDRPQRLPNCD